MRTHGMLALTVGVLLGAAAFAQPPAGSPPRQGPGVQAARDAREPAVLAACKHPPAPQGPFQRPPGFVPPSSKPVEYQVSAIAGVIAAGEKWKTIWTVEGNNADGIVVAKDGGILIAQNDNSAVVELYAGSGKSTTLFTDTNTGGALSMSKNGTLFIVQRGLNPSIWELAPQRKLFANMYEGDPFDCLGSVLNDLMADGKGGVYFTQGGLYYADAHGVVTKYGENLRTNGIILSPDEKTLYVTNAASVAAFDVEANGALGHQRELAKLPPNEFGDGSTIDRAGRLFVTGGYAVHVISAQGEYLGAIPTPFAVISLTFGGPGKKILYAVGETGDAPKQAAAILEISTLTAGYNGRAK
jgi:gluconolactonase